MNYKHLFDIGWIVAWITFVVFDAIHPKTGSLEWLAFIVVGGIVFAVVKGLFIGYLKKRIGE